MNTRILLLLFVALMPLRLAAAEGAIIYGEDRVTALAGKRVVVEGLA